MTTPTEATITALRAYAGLQALVGNGDSPETYRIYYIVRPQDDALPAVTIQNVAQTRVNSLADAGGAGVENARTRVTIYAETIKAAEAVAEQCRLALADAASIAFKSIPLLKTDDYDDDTKLYRVIVDHSIWYRH